jgi:CheY-like chemotaxis protein
MRRKILVVDDDADVRIALTELLELEGYEVVTATNGQEALDYLGHASELPALVLLDLRMPMVDGVQFRSEQRRDPTLARIPVVIVTAGRQAALSGFDAPILSKPLRADTLLKTIDTVIAS